MTYNFNDMGNAHDSNISAYTEHEHLQSPTVIADIMVPFL